MNEISMAVLSIVSFVSVIGIWGFTLGLTHRIKDLENKLEQIQLKIVEMSYYCEKFKSTLEIKTNSRPSAKKSNKNSPIDDFKDIL